MTWTTPPRPLDVLAEIPELAAYSGLLPPDLRERLEEADEQWEDEADLSYQHDLSTASGCKAGGWAAWRPQSPVRAQHPIAAARSGRDRADKVVRIVRDYPRDSYRLSRT